MFRLPFTCGVLLCCFVALAAGADPERPLLKDLKDLDQREIKLGEDEPGCKDTAILARFQGCNIIQCGTKEADSIELQVGATADGSPQKEMADGASEILYYLCPSKQTPSHIVKQAEGTLIKAGYRAVFSGKDGDEMPVVTLQKEDQYVQISTYVYNNYSAYVLTVVKLAPEPPVTAEAMAEELKGSGKFLLTGVNFEADKVEISGEAEKALAELAGALKAAPDVKVRLDVHTDDLEGPKTSQELSEKRAAAIASWLTAHGVEKDRITAQGFGSSKPVADNTTDDGRAKNRRVEIVKI